MPQFVHHATYKSIATISLNRPELHNAFNEQMIGELTAEFETVQQLDEVRLIVLAGEGRSFCAGADLNWMQKMVDYSIEENMADASALARLMLTVRECRKPTLARIHGAVFGGGVGLVAACDLAVALEKVMFCLSEVRLGIAPAVIAPILQERLSPAGLRRFALTAESFDAIEAARIGLLTEVVESPEEMDRWIRGIGDAVRQTGPRAVAATKKLLREINTLPMSEAMPLAAGRIAELRVSTEGQEGLRAFLEKRRPDWQADD